MAKADLVRDQLLLPRAISARLEALAATPGVTKSSILAAAVIAVLDRRGAKALDERFGQGLDRISSQFARIERDGHVSLESLALFAPVDAPPPMILSHPPGKIFADADDKCAIGIAGTPGSLVQAERA